MKKIHKFYVILSDIDFYNSNMCLISYRIYVREKKIDEMMRLSEYLKNVYIVFMFYILCVVL